MHQPPVLSEGLVALAVYKGEQSCRVVSWALRNRRFRGEVTVPLTENNKGLTWGTREYCTR